MCRGTEPRAKVPEDLLRAMHETASRRQKPPAEDTQALLASQLHTGPVHIDAPNKAKMY